jgi:hypothetical protein
VFAVEVPDFSSSFRIASLGSSDAGLSKLGSGKMASSSKKTLFSLFGYNRYAVKREEQKKSKKEKMNPKAR